MTQTTSGRAARPAVFRWAGCRGIAAVLALAASGLAPAAEEAILPLTHLTIPDVSPVPLPDPVIIEPAELAARVKAEMDRQLEEGGIVGAAVAVVKDGQVLLSHGYGYSDRARKIPVDGNTTLFRAGSVSKLFTATAVMQLVERGELALDADVNDYLQHGLLRIPDSFAQPVTLKNLMTHTAGFEANSFGYMQVNSAAQLKPFGAVLAEHIPARVRPPVTDFNRGEGAAYSNWGMALAGYIVALRAGLSFDDYTDQQLFKPLEMHHSSFREPLPPALQPLLSKGYQGGEPYEPHGMQYYHAMAPAGSLSASAGDMAHFMIAQLQGGRFQDRRILSEQSARAMQKRELSPSPYLDGAGLGWIEKYWNGRRLLWHPGSTVYFYSELYLLPDHGLGLYVVYNSTSARAYAGALMKDIMTHYFPAMLPLMRPSPVPRATLEPYAGMYAATARSWTTWEKIYVWQGATQVALTSKDELIMGPAEMGSPWLAPAAHPAVLRSADGDAMISVSQPPDGGRYVLGPDPLLPSSRLSPVETPAFNQALMRGFQIAFAAGLLLAAWGGWRGGTKRQRRTFWLAGALSLSNLAVLYLIDEVLRIDPLDMMIALAPQLYAAFTLGLLSCLLSLGLLVALATTWKTPWPAPGRIGCAALALIALGFLLWLDYWNLLGFKVA